MTELPSVRRRIIGTALRRYRLDLGYDLADAARILECDRSKISRIETGQRGIRPRDLRELLSQYGVEQAMQATLSLIAAPHGGNGWWRGNGDWPEAYSDFLILEATASKIMIYEPQQVPDLLQHQDYSKAVAGVRAGVPKNSALLRLAEVRTARQDLVLRAKQTEMEVVLGEGALRQSPSGQHVMRAQLAALIGACGFPNLSLQILPFASGAPVAAGAAPFTIFCYAETSLSVVYLPGFSGGTFCIGEDDITPYTLAFAQLKASALTEPASVRMISTADPSPRTLYAANRA